MSYDLTLQCGCVVYVSAHPTTRVVHTRIIQSRGGDCRVRRHEVGLRLYLWELLPEPSTRLPIDDLGSDNSIGAQRSAKSVADRR
jgi:hypothetical protein